MSLVQEMDVLIKKIEAIALVNDEIIKRVQSREVSKRFSYSVDYDSTQQQFVIKEVINEVQGKLFA